MIKTMGARASRTVAALALLFALLAASLAAAGQAQAFTACTGTGSGGTHCYGNLVEGSFWGNGGYASSIYAMSNVKCSRVNDVTTDFVTDTIWAGLTNGTTFEVGQGSNADPGHTGSQRWFYTTRYGGGFTYQTWHTTIQAPNNSSVRLSINWTGTGWLLKENTTTVLTANGPSYLIQTAQGGAETTRNSDQIQFDLWGIGRTIAATGVDTASWPGATLGSYWAPPFRDPPLIGTTSEVQTYQSSASLCA